jgi:hypothetical protein
MHGDAQQATPILSNSTEVTEKRWWKRIEENVLLLHTLTTLASIWTGVLLEANADEVGLVITPRVGYFTGAPLWGAYAFFLLVGLTIALTIRSFKVQDRLRREDEGRRRTAETALLSKSHELAAGTETLLVEAKEMRLRTDELLHASSTLSTHTDEVLSQAREIRTLVQTLPLRTDELLQASSTLSSHTTEVLGQAREIRTLVQTLPPANFVNAYVEYVVAAQGAWSDLLEEHTRGGVHEDAIKKGIRVVLKAVAEMFKVYDNAREDTHVAANLMLFIPRNSFDTSRMVGDRAVRMAFASEGQQWRSLAGVLLLHPTLSAIAGARDSPPDPDITPLYFPVPIDQKVRGASGDLWTVLPGAPLAWVSRTPTSNRSPEALLEWCEHEAALPPEVHTKLAEYLKEARRVHSFVSVPFPLADAPESNPIAVLNVHSSAPGLLEGKDRALLVLVKPITEVLCSMLKMLSDVRRAAGKPAQLAVAHDLQQVTRPKYGDMA